MSTNTILRTFICSLLLTLPFISLGKTPIFGAPEVSIDHMYAYVSRHNPDFNREVAEAFYNVGCRYGTRGDIALCQAIIETGWFRFDNGTAVSPDAHNYCGLGVKRRGDKGCTFSSVEEGVTAMIQHLYAYACSGKLPAGEKVIDPRFSYVRRGCAPTWEKLAGRWAMNPRYGHNIMRIYSGLAARAASGKEVMFIGVDIPDDMLDGDEDDFIDIDTPHDVESDTTDDNSPETSNNDIFK